MIFYIYELLLIMGLYKKYLRNRNYIYLISVLCDGESTSIFIQQIYASLGLGEFISPTADDGASSVLRTSFSKSQPYYVLDGSSTRPDVYAGNW